MEHAIAKTPTSDLMNEAERLGTAISASTGLLLDVVCELDKRQAWRVEGATSQMHWLAQRCGVAQETGRVWSHVAGRLDDLPHLAEGLRSGVLSFDKIRAVVDTATPESDAAMRRQAEECSVPQLKDLARDQRPAKDVEDQQAQANRYLRFSDAHHSISARMSQDAYAIVRAAITKGAKALPSDGETPWDQRQCDALINLCRLARHRGRSVPEDKGNGATGASGPSGANGANGGPEGREEPTDSEDGSGGGDSGTSGFFVVAHTDLALLRGGTGRAEIERLGLLSPEAIRRISCDAMVALALDDAFGHTMYEGRARRFPSNPQRREVQRRDRRCRFPGCVNATFTDVHHIAHWADDGLTDIDNLVTLCSHHHHLIHERKWSMSGNANGILRFVGPNQRAMTSRPSPLWTRPREHSVSVR
jgi:HNH endonuclease/uncharacterized protein DUF222